MAKKIGWDLGKMPEKISAVATFHGQLAKELQTNPTVYKMISSAGAKLISKYFDSYVDHVAKIDAYRYHHIYEFGKTGFSTSRLFKSSIKNGEITYTLVESTKPNDNGYLFKQKAFVMEAGDPITIVPQRSRFLAYQIDGEEVFSKSSVIKNPGGKYVAGAFEKLFQEFFSSNLPSKALTEFGFYDTIDKAMYSESERASVSIDAGDLKSSASKAARAAYGIAGKVEQNVNRL